ncbi:hypothetical protein AX16_009685 [Volvariella volvacea WC 439]|nr:hypothetical protein AX16_009685 [Volvariella volvacea WC 439]
MSSSSNAQQPATGTWTEPPWSGWIETTGDALLILEAARRGLIPRVTRRLVDSERKMITSGSVFVFDEDESGIKRWTDGFFWSPSRILGNFLLYRETDKRGAGGRGARGDSNPTDVNDQSQYSVDGSKQESHSLSRPKGEPSSLDKHKERSLYGSLTNSYKFKPDGLMKKTFSLTIRGASQHLISYYKIEDVESGRLRSPSSLPELASLDISPEYLDKTHFRNPPKVEIGLDGIPRYRGEADDIDAGPSLLSGPLSSGLPLMSDPSTSNAMVAGGKRPKRYDPYPAQKQKSRRNTKSGPDGPNVASPSAVIDQQLAPSTPITPAGAPVVGGMQAHSYPHPPPPSSVQQPYHDPATSSYPPPASHAPPPPHYAPYGHMAGYYQVPPYVYPAPGAPASVPTPSTALIPATSAHIYTHPPPPPPGPSHQYAYSGYPAPVMPAASMPEVQPNNSNQPSQPPQAPPQAQVITTYQPGSSQNPSHLPPPPPAQPYSYYYPPPYTYPTWPGYTHPAAGGPGSAAASNGVPATPASSSSSMQSAPAGYGQAQAASEGGGGNGGGGSGSTNPPSSGTDEDIRGGAASGGDDSDRIDES